jgi:hypothetical protein
VQILEMLEEMTIKNPKKCDPEDRSLVLKGFASPQRANFKAVVVRKWLFSDVNKFPGNKD